MELRGTLADSHHPAHALQKPPDSSLVFEHYPSRSCCSRLACRLGPCHTCALCNSKRKPSSVGLQPLLHCAVREGLGACSRRHPWLCTSSGTEQCGESCCPLPCRQAPRGAGSSGCFRSLWDAHISPSLYPVIQVRGP